MIHYPEGWSDGRPRWAAAAIRDNPLGYLVEALSAERALAALLEDVADALPGASRTAPASIAAARLRHLAGQRPSIEEIALHRPAESIDPPESATLRAIAIARRETALVAGQALELADELDVLAQTGRAVQPEALGFMLRACFDALRRRLDWIETAILPGVLARLDDAALTAIGEALASQAEGLGASQRWSNRTRT